MRKIMAGNMLNLSDNKPSKHEAVRNDNSRSFAFFSPSDSKNNTKKSSDSEKLRSLRKTNENYAGGPSNPVNIVFFGEKTPDTDVNLLHYFVEYFPYDKKPGIYDTDNIYEESRRKNYLYKDQDWSINFYDTRGQETFAAMRELFMQNGDIIIYCAPVWRDDSLSRMLTTRNQIVKQKNKEDINFIVAYDTQYQDLWESTSEKINTELKNKPPMLMSFNHKTFEGMREIIEKALDMYIENLIHSNSETKKTSLFKFCS